VKVRVVLRLRAETTVTHEWMAEQLQMGRHSNLSNLVYANKSVKSENQHLYVGQHLW